MIVFIISLMFLLITFCFVLFMDTMINTNNIFYISNAENTRLAANKINSAHNETIRSVTIAQRWFKKLSVDDKVLFEITKVC